jgi:hypothetical protein
VARVVGESEYQWLVDDLTKKTSNSFSDFDGYGRESMLYSEEDVRTFKNVKLSVEHTIANGESLETIFNDVSVATFSAI